MKRHPIPAAVLVTLACLLVPIVLDGQQRGRSGSGPERNVRQGSPERGLRLGGLGGEELREADLSRGETIVVFWASWSPKCRDIAGRVNALGSRWSSSVRVVTVNFQEEPEEAREFLEGKRMTAPVFLDRTGAFAKKHGVATLPSLLLFREGKVLYRGAFPADADRLIAATFGKVP